MRYNSRSMSSSRFPFLLRTAAGLLAAGAMGMAQAKELLVVGATFARIFERTEAGEFVGLGAELARSIARQQGLDIKFGLYPWARAQDMVAKGAADVLVGPYKTPARDVLFAFADAPFYQDNMVFYKLARSKASWDGSYASLKGKRLVAVLGWAYGQPFDQERASLGVTNASTVESGLSMLLNDRMDFFVANERNTLAGMAALGKQDAFAVVSPMIGTEVGYFAFGKGADHDAIRQAFNAGMGRLIASGEYLAMARRYNITVPAALAGKQGTPKPTAAAPATR